MAKKSSKTKQRIAPFSVPMNMTSMKKPSQTKMSKNTSDMPSSPPSSTETTKTETLRHSLKQVVINSIDDLEVACEHFGLEEKHQRREWNSDPEKSPLIAGFFVRRIFDGTPAYKTLGEKKPVWVTFSVNSTGDLIKKPLTRTEWVKTPGLLTVYFEFNEDGTLKSPTTLLSQEEYPHETLKESKKKRSKMPPMKFLDQSEIKSTIKEMKKQEKVVHAATEKAKGKIVEAPLDSLFS